MGWMDILKKAVAPKTALPELDPGKTPKAPVPTTTPGVAQAQQQPGGWMNQLGQAVSQGVTQNLVKPVAQVGQAVAGAVGQKPAPTAQDLAGSIQREWMKRLAGETGPLMQGFTAQNAADIAATQQGLADKFGGRVAKTALARMQAQAESAGQQERQKFQETLLANAPAEAAKFLGQQQSFGLDQQRLQVEQDKINKEFESREADRKQRETQFQQEFNFNLQKFGQEYALAQLKQQQDALARERQQDQSETTGWLNLLGTLGGGLVKAIF